MYTGNMIEDLERTVVKIDRRTWCSSGPCFLIAQRGSRYCEHLHYQCENEIPSGLGPDPIGLHTQRCPRQATVHHLELELNLCPRCMEISQ